MQQCRDLVTKWAQGLRNHASENPRLWAALCGALGTVFLAKLAAAAYIKWHEKQLGPNEVVLITGGGSGIGQLLAFKLVCHHKCKVVVLDINVKGLDQTVSMIRQAGGGGGDQIHAYECDITDYQRVYAVAEKIRNEVGIVTILINNAGVVSGKPLDKLSESQIETTLKVNTLSHAWTIKAFLPDMIEKKYGHIVTIASCASFSGTAGLADYCASKFAAFGFAESIRMEMRKRGLQGPRGQGIQSLTVCPYYINTGMFDGVKTKFPFLLPILKPEYVVNQIIRAIKRSDQLLIMPSFPKLVFLFRFLCPVGMQDWMSELLGISDSMNDFKGKRAIPASSQH